MTQFALPLAGLREAEQDAVTSVGQCEALRAEAVRAWGEWDRTRDQDRPVIEAEMLAALPPGWWWSDVLPRAFPHGNEDPPPIGLIVEVTRSTYPGPVRLPPSRPSHPRSCTPGVRVVIGHHRYRSGRPGVIWSHVERTASAAQAPVLRGGFNTTGFNWTLMTQVMRRVAWADFGAERDPALQRCGVNRPTIDRDEMARRIAAVIGDLDLPRRRCNQKHGRP